MNELMKILGQTGQAMTFDQIRIPVSYTHLDVYKRQGTRSP